MALKGFSHKLSLAVVPVLYQLITKLLFSSYRQERQGDGLDYVIQRIAAGKPIVAAIWHYGVIYFPHLAIGPKWTSMVSASADGDYISRILQQIGYETVRGSRTRGGVAALKGLIKAMGNGRNVSIIADGSQGPAKIAQPGSVLLASKTGNPIIPVAWGAERYWAFNSWDKTVLPKPFSKVSVYIGSPIHVPSSLSRENLEEFRFILQERINEIYDKAWGEFGINEH